MQMVTQYVHASWERAILMGGYKYLLPLAAVTLLLLINRFIQRSLTDISWALENIIGAGIIFSSGIWLLLLPVIHLGFKRWHMKTVSRLKFILCHLSLAVVAGVVQSYLFVYSHYLVWPGILDPKEVLSSTYLMQDIRLNFFIYWALIGGYYLLNSSSQVRKPLLKIKCNSRFISIPKEKIILIKALGNYLQIIEVLPKGTKNHIVRCSMHQICQQLATTEFYRVHRSYIVNRNFVREYRKGTHGEFLLTLNTGETISTSRSQKSKIASWLQGSQKLNSI